MHYTRIGTTEILKEKIKDAKSKGAKVEEDRDAGIVTISVNGEEALWVIQKDFTTWIFRYNSKFYPEPKPLMGDEHVHQL